MARLKQAQEDFTVHYFKNGNETKSAILAGYSEKSAHVAGCRLLKNVKVLARLNELRDQAANPAVGDLKARKERLWELATEDNPTQYGYSRTPNIQAIDTLCKLDGDYAPERHPLDNVTVKTFIFILPDGTRLDKLSPNKVELLEEGKNV